MRFFLTTILFLVTHLALGMFMRPTQAPIDRLIKNAEAYLKKHPKDDNGYFILGRIHYLAFAGQNDQIAVYDADNPLPYFQKPPRWFALKLPANDVKIDDIDAWNKHVEAAVSNLRKAILLKPKSGLYHLGLGSIYMQYLQLRPKRKDDDFPPTLKQITPMSAFDMLYRAYTLSVDKAMDHDHIPLRGLRSITAYESARLGVNMVETGIVKDATGVKSKVGRMRKTLKRLAKLPMGPITPIIFAMTSSDTINQLTSPQTKVTFDLDGDGSTETWPWLKPDTAFLVWDPTASGQIQSGRQLFGTGTWWLLCSDGYRAMNLLDDNRNGRLDGKELRGLSAWFDRNSNGLSEPGEVITVQAIGITAIKVQPSEPDATILSNHEGLELEDGRTLPTYDWVVRPATDSPHLPLRRN